MDRARAESHQRATGAARPGTASAVRPGTASASGTARPSGTSTALLRATHPGPVLAVTTIAGLLAVAAGRPATTVALVTAAVLCGQLSVGWGNDLVDLARDRVTGRADKPLATGELGIGTARVALGLAVAACVVLSALLGWRAALAHLGCVGLAHAYNLGLKATVWSWLPYAGAFGLLPAVATLAVPDPARPAWWAVLAGAVLGVAAHLVNAVPDLDDDARTGVRGLPHRLGARRSRVGATLLLLVASALAVLGPGGPVATWSLVVLAAVGALAVVALRGEGRWPFRAAMLIALLDVVLLLGATA
ncbi:UbiA family prenyltransferase [Nocardioides sp. zg-DK7169]|uniref:UbiA family prenyltransferase n=1 Tax=Nocardioides sp. zg-DK7169 TaxID=2736600 RepID=UPI0015538580|nr:UbiA family prenyltransferase [Nocardioides sp. zg-DK7169]NPC96820.1 UbiA family prenyltransferase [Nocardioides sp. zg-DK7169]